MHVCLFFGILDIFSDCCLHVFISESGHVRIVPDGLYEYPKRNTHGSGEFMDKRLLQLHHLVKSYQQFHPCGKYKLGIGSCFTFILRIIRIISS